MKELSATFGITLAVSLAVFAIADWVIDNDRIAEGVAAFPLVASPHVYESWDRLQARAGRAAHGAAPSQSTQFSMGVYTKPWWLLALCGSLVTAGIMQATPLLCLPVVFAIATLIGAGFDDGSFLLSAMFVSIPFVLAGNYLVGRWI